MKAFATIRGICFLRASVISIMATRQKYSSFYIFLQTSSLLHSPSIDAAFRVKSEKSKAYFLKSKPYFFESKPDFSKKMPENFGVK